MFFISNLDIFKNSQILIRQQINKISRYEATNIKYILI